MADKILIVDDDPSICKLLEKVMHSSDLETTVTDSGQVALHLLKNHVYGIILVDAILGDIEGFEVIKAPRSQDIKTLVVIINGHNEDYDSLYGPSIGADDYITKPFRPLVLGIKVEALARRSKNLSSDNPDQLECGPFSYSTSAMRFYKDDEKIFLSSRKSNLMLLFMRHPEQIFTKEVMYEHVWGNTTAVDDNAIIARISHLHSKVEEDRQKSAHIMTVRDPGYRFVP